MKHQSESSTAVRSNQTVIYYAYHANYCSRNDQTVAEQSRISLSSLGSMTPSEIFAYIGRLEEEASERNEWKKKAIEESRSKTEAVEKYREQKKQNAVLQAQNSALQEKHSPEHTDTSVSDDTLGSELQDPNANIAMLPGMEMGKFSNESFSGRPRPKQWRSKLPEIKTSEDGKQYYLVKIMQTVPFEVSHIDATFMKHL